MCIVSYLLLGEHIRSARKNLKLRQIDVADLAGVSLSYYGKLERGKIHPNVERLARICRTLKVSLTVVFYGVDDMPVKISEKSKTLVDGEFMKFFTNMDTVASDRAKIVMMVICEQVMTLEK